MAPLVTRYLRACLDVEVELPLTDHYVDVVDEGYDAVLRLDPIKDTALAAREFAVNRQAVCASPVYLAANGAPASPEDLAAHECLGFVNWSRLPYAEWRLTRAGHRHTVQVRSRFQINDGRPLLAAALDGYGIILQPEAVVRDDLDANRLVHQVLPAYDPPSRPLHLLFSARRPQTPKLRSCIDCVVHAFGRQAG